MFPLFATGVIVTGNKFAAGVVNTGGELPPQSLTPVSTTLEERVAKFVFDTVGKFATAVVVEIGGAH